MVIPDRRVQSAVNGRLELNFTNGRKVLDSANTNYSYGSLQQVLRYGLRKMDVSAVSSVLVLGLGGGSVIGTLRKDFGFTGPVTGVDVDPVILDLASGEYGLKEDKNLQMVCMDALGFLRDHDQQFDLIIIDLFVDNDVPAFVFDLFFWQQIHRHLNSKGQFILNAGFVHQSELMKPVVLRLYDRFSIVEFAGPGGLNKLVTGGVQ